ncbi:hypothetical protein CDAR_186831 [Caerostris darwini]|uniref:Uncharacterized protein n=1 Tax=Caerostris darwini TaxID=1538125 RepID=A0AAV4PQB9_9ARAC|nr:hypothetical protein CDAR_186831 [Caerostris darwini]
MIVNPNRIFPSNTVHCFYKRTLENLSLSYQNKTQGPPTRFPTCASTVTHKNTDRTCAPEGVLTTLKGSLTGAEGKGQSSRKKERGEHPEGVKIHPVWV